MPEKLPDEQNSHADMTRLCCFERQPKSLNRYIIYTSFEVGMLPARSAEPSRVEERSAVARHREGLPRCRIQELLERLESPR